MTTTPEPVYGRNLVYVSLKPHVRHAVWKQTGAEDFGGPEIRDMVLEGLKANGWDEAQMQAEYVQYAAKCAETGTVNQFPGGRV